MWCGSRDSKPQVVEPRIQSMKWSEAIAGVGVVATAGSGDAGVRGVQYDSRRVSAGDVFVAMRGGTTDGNKFVEAALKNGAAAVVTDSEETFARLRSERPDLAVALVEHGRRRTGGGKRGSLWASRRKSSS